MTTTTHLDTRAPGQPGTVSVYEAIGGRVAVAAAVDNFYGRLLADPVLGGFFPGGVGARHRAFVVTLLGQALGGPQRYRGPDLGAAHRGLGISHAHFDAAAAHLAASLDELGVPVHLAEQVVAVVAGLRSAVVSGRGRRRATSLLAGPDGAGDTCSGGDRTAALADRGPTPGARVVRAGAGRGRQGRPGDPRPGRGRQDPPGR